MNFQLTEERQMLQDGLRRFLRDTVTPDLLAKATDSETGHSETLWQGLTEMGIQGAMFTEEQGGFGGAGFDIMVVFEELGRAGVFEPVLESAVLAGGLAQDAAQIEAIIGGAILSLAHAEPTSRYDLSHLETRAEQTASGYRINGHKAVVHHAGAASNLVVSARISGEAADEDGISLFLIPADAVQMRDYALNGGGRAAEIALDLEVPESALIGGEGGAFAALEQANARATAAICAEALGLMEAIKTLTVDYLRQRKQFGQPIGKFQALQHRMADVLIEIEQARSAVINLCGHLEADRATREVHVSAAKNLIGRVGRLVVEEAIQMHGGIGMTQEYELGHLAKRLTMIDHRFGDSDYHLERFIRLAAA
ncbi:acyl-CoA dehydrogenase family protein [Primorskyibacter sp. 2E233]|uniref:acyl-CoA dehydrogenase family protein n=1 Tax=Primorskyibacter sp. 2E233 TaxID=3413431 RepID=UPI003BF0366C